MAGDGTVHRLPVLSAANVRHSTPRAEPTETASCHETRGQLGVGPVHGASISL